MLNLKWFFIQRYDCYVNSIVIKNSGNNYKLLNVTCDKDKLFTYLLQVVFPNEF